jgi:hypothetical protein
MWGDIYLLSLFSLSHHTSGENDVEGRGVDVRWVKSQKT